MSIDPCAPPSCVSCSYTHAQTKRTDETRGQSGRHFRDNRTSELVYIPPYAYMHICIDR